jgi:ketosteroid isomerase-like protein
MSEQDNVQTVQRFYNALFAGDIPTTLTLVTEDVDVLMYGAPIIPWTGPRRGRRELEQNLRLITDAHEFQAFQMNEFIVAKESVVILGNERCRVRATGRVVEAQWAQVFTFRDGLISRYREYSDTEAWERGFDEISA